MIGGITGYLYGDKIKSTYTKYENQIIGGAQVASGVLTVAGTIGSNNIAAGMSHILTDQEVTTEDVIAWSGLVPMI